MKEKIISICIIVILILTIFYVPISNADTDLAENELLIFKGKTITKTTTIEQVNSMFGKPNLETINAFGGKSYSYINNDYSDYLYIETNSAGKIVAYGAIGGDFKGKRYAEGDRQLASVPYLSGSALSDIIDGKLIVYGIIEYNCENSDINTFWENYENNSSKYLYEIQKHAVEVAHVVAERNGWEFYQTYPSEEIFYMNEQLKYNGSNLDEYAENSRQTEQIQFIRGYVEDFWAEFPNPIMLGGETDGYLRAENFKYLLCDVEITNYEGRYKDGEVRIIYVDPTFLDESVSVELTDEEKQKLSAAQAQNEKFLEKLKEVRQLSGYYDEEPQYDELPLVAGKYKDAVLEATTDYLNITRVGLGLGTLELNEDMATAAQHKAVLVYYMNKHDMETGHNPIKPDGVSEEFYKIAQSYLNENLYHGDVQISIIRALNDGNGDSVTCGHRYNLLEPRYTEWGVGDAGKGLSIQIQACHKFSGNREYDNELVAWPANGITSLEMISNGIGNWTAKFYKNYTVSDDTTVTVENLATGKKYEITESYGSTKFLRVTKSQNMVTFRDDSIVYKAGDVFKITLHNIKDSSGKTTDYTYRSVFYDFDDDVVSTATDISLNKSTVDLTVGSSERVLAKVIPEDADIKLMKFSSANENIAKVRQDGTITGIKEGTTTITVECEGITKKIEVTVKKYLRGDINQDGIVNGNDVNYGMRGIVGKITLTELEKQIGDVNDDDVFNANDINKIMRYIVGKINTL